MDWKFTFYDLLGVTQRKLVAFSIRCWQIGGQEVSPNERMGEENIKSKDAQAFTSFMLHYVGKQILSKTSVLRNPCKVSSIKAIQEGTFMDAKIDSL